MKGKVGVVLILLFTAFLLWGISYMSIHDSIEEVVDVSTLELGRGRLVHLIGIAPSAVYVQTETDESAESISHAPTLQVATTIFSLDTVAVATVREGLLDAKVALEFTQQFTPDTSSQDLHAYVRLENGVDVGEWLLTEGLAKLNPDHSHPREVEYASFQSEAKLNRLGLWAAEEREPEGEPEVAPAE